MSVLAIAPHADDEVLGCGGTIRRFSNEGRDVHLCIVTEGYEPEWSAEHLANRPDEISAAADILGVTDWEELGHPSVKLDTIGQKRLNDDIAAVVESVDPETILLPHPGDLNHDHGLVFEAGLVAARPHSGVDRILAYETLSESEWGSLSQQFDPTVYVDISETVEKKIEAMNAYESEIREYPHPRTERAIRALATKRGTEAHLKAAEAFQLVRERI